MENNNDLVTKGFLTETLNKAFDDFEKRLMPKIAGMVTEIVTAVVTEQIDSLARLVNKGFMDMEYRLDKRISDLEQKVDSLDMHLSAYATQWSRDFDNCENRLRVLEGKRAR